MFGKPLVKVVKCWEDNDLTESRRIPTYIVKNQFYNAEHWVQCTQEDDSLDAKITSIIELAICSVYRKI